LRGCKGVNNLIEGFWSRGKRGFQGEGYNPFLDIIKKPDKLLLEDILGINPMVVKMIRKIKEWFSGMHREMVGVFKLETAPQKIALGVAIGIFMNFLPSMGIGAILAFIAARIFRASAAAAVTTSLATGFLIPFLYTLNVFTGRLLITNTGLEEITVNIEASMQQTIDSLVTPLQHSELFLPLLSSVKSLTIDFLLGSVINAFIAGILIYGTLRFALKKKKQPLLEE